MIGVPDERLGEVGHAFVVPRPGCTPDPRRGHRVRPRAHRQLQGAACGDRHLATCRAPRSARSRSSGSRECRASRVAQGRRRVADKRMTEDEVVGRLRSGMTIGIGGWGSRRKPMSLVRAILRSDLTDLTVVSYGGPDVGLLLRGGQGTQAGLRVRVARLHPARPALPRRPPAGPDRGRRVRRGHAPVGLYAAAMRLPFLPTRAGLGSDWSRHQPGPAHGHLDPYERRGTARDARAARSTPRSCT